MSDRAPPHYGYRHHGSDGEKVPVGPLCFAFIDFEDRLCWTQESLRNLGALSGWKCVRTAEICATGNEFCLQVLRLTAGKFSRSSVEALFYSHPPLISCTDQQRDSIDIISGYTAGPLNKWESMDPSFISACAYFSELRAGGFDQGLKTNKKGSYVFSTSCLVFFLFQTAYGVRPTYCNEALQTHDNLLQFLDLLVSNSDENDPCRLCCDGWEAIGNYFFAKDDPDARSVKTATFKANAYKFLFGKGCQNVEQIDDLFLSSDWFSSDPATVGDRPENSFGRSTTDLFVFFIRALSVKRNQLSSTMLGLLLLGRVRCPRSVKKLFQGAPFCHGNAADPAAGPGVFSPSFAWRPDFACLDQGTRFHIRMLTLVQCVAQTIDRLAYDAVTS